MSCNVICECEIFCRINYFLINFLSRPYQHHSFLSCVLFGLRFYIPVNSYGHVDMVSLPNYTFFPVQA